MNMYSFLVLLNILYLVELKSLQLHEDETNGEKFSYIYENSYLRESPKVHEGFQKRHASSQTLKRYVPEVNGRPIFIPSLNSNEHGNVKAGLHSKKTLPKYYWSSNYHMKAVPEHVRKDIHITHVTKDSDEDLLHEMLLHNFNQNKVNKQIKKVASTSKSKVVKDYSKEMKDIKGSKAIIDEMPKSFLLKHLESEDEEPAEFMGKDRNHVDYNEIDDYYKPIITEKLVKVNPKEYYEQIPVRDLTPKNPIYLNPEELSLEKAEEIPLRNVDPLENEAFIEIIDSNILKGNHVPGESELTMKELASMSSNKREKPKEPIIDNYEEPQVIKVSKKKIPIKSYDEQIETKLNKMKPSGEMLDEVSETESMDSAIKIKIPLKPKPVKDLSKQKHNEYQYAHEKDPKLPFVDKSKPKKNKVEHVHKTPIRPLVEDYESPVKIKALTKKNGEMGKPINHAYKPMKEKGDSIYLDVYPVTYESNNVPKQDIKGIKLANKNEKGEQKQEIKGIKLANKNEKGEQKQEIKGIKLANKNEKAEQKQEIKGIKLANKNEKGEQKQEIKGIKLANKNEKGEQKQEIKGIKLANKNEKAEQKQEIKGIKLANKNEKAEQKQEIKGIKLANKNEKGVNKQEIKGIKLANKNEKGEQKQEIKEIKLANKLENTMYLDETEIDKKIEKPTQDSEVKEAGSKIKEGFELLEQIDLVTLPIIPHDDIEEFKFEDPNNVPFEDGSGIIQERNLNQERNLFSESGIWSQLLSFHTQERSKFKKCITPKNETGNCMPIQLCPDPNLALTLDDLMKKVCSIDDVFIGICCAEFSAETLKVDWENLNPNPTEPEDVQEIETTVTCGQIVNSGKDVLSWPWMAPLISASTRKIFCGGALINERYILTAAHCTRRIPHNQILVILGPINSTQNPLNQEFTVGEIKRHTRYNPRTMQNDIALLKLSRPVPMGEFRRFICLPDETDAFVADQAIMLGWQGSFTMTKNVEHLRILPKEECRNHGEEFICTEPRTEDSLCNLDSGAPLMMEKDGTYTVIGILTWNRNDCDSRFPEIYTNVSHFRKWIDVHSSS